jgi:tritrans,polycis-undecaprenyl-diphosphate synthase [geranylgeranyl-diphosphate specific]
MNIPQHIVIVPDGNRRWAKKRNRPSHLGHRAGAKAIETIFETALEMKIPCITAWGSSVSNVTDRSPAEIKFLFIMFEQLFKKIAKNKKLYSEEVQVRVVGRWEEFFPDSLKKIIRDLMKATEKHTRHKLTLLMAYSGTDEMLAAVRETVEQGKKDPDMPVNEKVLKGNLWTKDLPAVDLVIRTGGEPHWSAGLMMWDVAEAHLYFTKTLWPDFAPAEFKRAINGFLKTERRFGR